LQPSDFDVLLDAAQADPEQNLPYWAELWPSGIALAAAIARNPGAVRGKRVVELGCGLGVAAIAALNAGAHLLVTDYAAEALALCALNCIAVTGQAPRGFRLNWRSAPETLPTAFGDPFPLVLAADVLYEARDVEPLLTLVPRLVAPGGELWLAEPGRTPAARFLEAIAANGWLGKREERRGPWPDPEDNHKGVVVTIHRLRRPAD
jgi:predicted nicotinamide N-methyase